MEELASGPPKVLWRPNHPEKTALWQFMQTVSKKRRILINNYQDFHAYSVGDRRLDFWEDLLQGFPIIYEGQYTQVRYTPAELACNLPEKCSCMHFQQIDGIKQMAALQS